MAEEEIDEARLNAGAEYLDALRKLGLNPDGLLWGFDVRHQSWVLVLITSFFDYAGPLELSKLLFRAYELAGTPKDIDPFIVRLHSPKQRIIRDLDHMLQTRIKVRDIDVEAGRWGEVYEAGEKAKITWVAEGDISVPLHAIYRFSTKGKGSVDVSRRWKFFTKQVDALAA